mgnify:CR=1 FL=1
MSRAGDVAAWATLVVGSLGTGMTVGHLATTAPTGAEPAERVVTCQTDAECMWQSLIEVGEFEDRLAWCESLPVSTVETDYPDCVNMVLELERLAIMDA